jgi:N-acetylmuramoyl-L-alanine amidase
MPCVLVETAFISHLIEGRWPARGVYRRDVAQGLRRNRPLPARWVRRRTL